MVSRSSKIRFRRAQVREQKAQTIGSRWMRIVRTLLSWPFIVGAVFVLLASFIALIGEEGIRHVPGERIEQPIYALVDFRVDAPAQRTANMEAAGAAVPSYYERNNPEVSVARIRADLKELHRAATESATFEAFEEAMKARKWPADKRAYDYLHSLTDPVAVAEFAARVDALPLENELIVKDLSTEIRDPRSAVDYVILLTRDGEENFSETRVRHADLTPQGSERQIKRSAADIARRLPFELHEAAQAIIAMTFSQQPTIVYDQQVTESAIRGAQKQVPEAFVTFQKGVPFINPHTRKGEAVLTDSDYDLLVRHHNAYLKFLQEPTVEATAARQSIMLSRIGLVTMVLFLSIALLAYSRLHQHRIFESRTHTIAYLLVVLVVLLVSRLAIIRWPQLPQMILGPCVLAAGIMSIVYPRRFAIGVMCLIVTLVAITIHANLNLFLILVTGTAVLCYQLEEIRTRTKVIRAGLLAAAAVFVAATATELLDRQVPEFVLRFSGYAAACTLLTAFVISGLVPYIEVIFGTATALSLLEWEDSRQPLLQQLAQRAPGTYNHSLVLGTLAAAGCEAIGANALLAEVAALYHDIGKIPKAEYFTENQEGRISRHDKLAPTISLLIILGHVKDGIEMAREYKLPRVLHQFIREHHGTTVVRYFHHMASERQEQLARGRHDREVPEAEFRYPGPKPQTKESAILMICDAVEGAARSLAEPTVGRIEHLVHEIVNDRLNDGQFDECDITLCELRLVQDAVVKSLSHIYHGRIAYPKKSAARAEQEQMEPPGNSDTGTQVYSFPRTGSEAR